jgi:archaellum component FlaD/FlaE
MNSTNNNSFEIAAKKVFSDLYALIKEDEKETEYKKDNKKTDDKNVISNKKDNKNVISNKKDNNKKDNKNVISNKKDNIKKDNKNVISNKIDNKNVISNEIDDKPKQVNLLEQINVLDDKIKPFNLLDLRPDILNIVGDFVKRREIKELMDEEQIINGKTIEIGTFIMTGIVVPLNTKKI